MDKNLDFIDISTGLASLCFVAANIAVTPFWAVPAFGLWFGLHKLRRTETFETWAMTVAEKNAIYNKTMPFLLPPPNIEEETSITLHQNKPLDVRVVNTPKSQGRVSGWYDRVTREPSAQQPIPIATGKVTHKLQSIEKQEKVSTSDNMAEVLALMPKYISYKHPLLPDAPTPMSVLVGYDPLGKKWVWADFGIAGDTIHTFIAGQTRAGKDSQIRLWFTQLTLNNRPEDVQFIVIDAKGEWATPSLKDSSHMFIPPVGGFSLKIERSEGGRRKLRDLANESIEDALITTIEKLQERQDEFTRVGALNLQSYVQKTGKKLPILFIVATDVGTNFEGILAQLIKFVVLKGGSLGVRAIISMQTASGEDTAWRGQIGMVMSGYQAQASADAPNLGIPLRIMKYRPSDLPSSDVIENRGLFVVRKGIDQYVVRGAHIPDSDFEYYCEHKLPRKSDVNLLENLIGIQPVIQHPVIQQQQITLTKEQSLIAVRMAALGDSPSTITKALGFTSSKRFNEMMPLITNIHKAVKTKQALQARGKRL